jgi:hypothetical protein
MIAREVAEEVGLNKISFKTTRPEEGKNVLILNIKICFLICHLKNYLKIIV